MLSNNAAHNKYESRFIIYVRLALYIVLRMIYTVSNDATLRRRRRRKERSFDPSFLIPRQVQSGGQSILIHLIHAPDFTILRNPCHPNKAENFLQVLLRNLQVGVIHVCTRIDFLAIDGCLLSNPPNGVVLHFLAFPVGRLLLSSFCSCSGTLRFVSPLKVRTQKSRSFKRESSEPEVRGLRK